ncbi:penicillin-binding protein 2 [Arthrobacter cryoconiti]|uniref:Peptidoglycan D,D-transpeptidase FtsI family protein n=1 Tax=Arthrobacter cryoconiti TaxID=748907 RepID=A0ABV8R414_9MICC|nr:penicillin-binding protein 2 [Arthrobacter cryoconiti]
MAHNSPHTAQGAAARLADKIGRGRMRIGFTLMLVFLLVIAGKLVMIQGLDVGNMAEAAETQRTVVQKLPAVRGKIVDSNGHVLAESIIRYDITVSQINSALYPQYKHRDAISGDVESFTREQGLMKLATVLGLPFEQVKANATGEKAFNYIVRDVSPAMESQVAALGVPGIYSEPQTKRVYPMGSVGGPIVGFLGSDGKGLAGIEQTFNEKLTGTDGSRTYQAGKNGIIIPTAPVKTVPSVDGASVTLTINQDIQYYAQQAAQQQKEQYSAQWVSITVLESKTGKLAAVADSDSYNPNDPGASATKDIGSRTVSSIVEPGSTDKTITASAVMAEGLATPLSQFLVPPTLSIDGQTFSDAFVHGTEKRTLAGIISDSMNTGTVLAGSKLTPEQRYNWFHKFGVGQKTGIELPGESPGILAPWQKWDGRQQYTVLFGQGVAQTPLQTAFVFQTVANNGTRLKPQIVDSFTAADGSVEKVQQAAGIEVLDNKTAQDMRDMLEGVVTMADYKVVNVPGYRVGGKTGTAEAPADNGVGFDGYTSSFIGMAPMEDPQYVVAITVQRPQGSIYGVTQGYTFNQVMGQVLRTFDVPPSTTPSVMLPKFYE